jgi:uncharacterized protein (TIGR00288 family)
MLVPGGTKIVQAPSTDETPRIALFIDFDNGQLDITRVLNALRERGIIILKKAYGDWGKFQQFRKVLAENGVDLVERPSIYAGGDKNGADIQLAVDALEACLTNPHIDVFAVVSGDSDFLPLISRLQAYNKKVVIVGMRKTTSAVVMRNCNEYLAYENLLKPPAVPTAESEPWITSSPSDALAPAPWSSLNARKRTVVPASSVSVIPEGTVTSPVSNTSPDQVSSAVNSPVVVGSVLSTVTVTPPEGTSIAEASSITRDSSV